MIAHKMILTRTKSSKMLGFLECLNQPCRFHFWSMLDSMHVRAIFDVSSFDVEVIQGRLRSYNQHATASAEHQKLKRILLFLAY